MAKKETLTFASIMTAIQKREYAPVYVLMGEENYFIDQITHALMTTVLTQDEKDFNEVVLYGADVTAQDIINEARFYPSFADRRVVLVKEAQLVKDLDKLAVYMQQVMPSTVLIINYRNGKLDGRTKFAGEVGKHGVLFESKKLYDNQVAGWISSYLQTKGQTIDPKAAAMLADFLGTDLSRIVKELDKLTIVQNGSGGRITPDLIEKNIGISKEFNNFELLKAVVTKDVLKANRIVNYFRDNPKSNPIVVTNTVLYNYFSKLMLCYYLPDKTENGVIKGLGLKGSFQAKDYMEGMRRYSALKTMQIIGIIRECDARSKGVGNYSNTTHDLLRETIYKILH